MIATQFDGQPRSPGATDNERAKCDVAGVKGVAIVLHKNDDGDEHHEGAEPHLFARCIRTEGIRRHKEHDDPHDGLPVPIRLDPDQESEAQLSQQKSGQGQFAAQGKAQAGKHCARNRGNRIGMSADQQLDAQGRSEAQRKEEIVVFLQDCGRSHAPNVGTGACPRVIPENDVSDHPER